LRERYVARIDTGTWQPTLDVQRDTIAPTAAAALHDLLDGEGTPPAPGDPLPPLWHWLAFHPRAAQRDLGRDGHPGTGTFLPPTEGRRRMAAGGTVTLHAPLPVGATVRRESLVTAAEEKQGRSGNLLFVTVEHRIFVENSPHDVPSVVEHQNIVYRTPEPSPPGGGDGDAGDETWPWMAELATEPTALFRFSALTYNAHRIHYDLPYTTTVEGYPGLVVQGPFQAIGLAELCRRFAPGRTVASFTFRAQRPAFGDNPLRLAGRPADDAVELAAIDHTGSVTLRATATFAPT